MNNIIRNSKPTFPTSHSLCSFRTSKAYLWGLVQKRLLELSQSSVTSLRCLDAACHALITRKMFPETCHYYGLDISTSRLQKAFSIKYPSDHLLKADLCRNIPLSSSFDVVVSLNTLSHLPAKQQFLALSNLIDFVCQSGSFFVNTDISNGLMDISLKLSSEFESVEVVYFDSYLSRQMENDSIVNSSNVLKLLQDNEFNVPNDASLHSQVLFIATKRLLGAKKNDLSFLNSSKITILNASPEVSKYQFANDLQFINSNLLSNVDVVLMTSRLFSSPSGSRLISLFSERSVNIQILGQFSPSPSQVSIFVLGLEAEWTSSIASDRISFNILRESEFISLSIVLVSQRDGESCSPSLIVSDY